MSRNPHFANALLVLPVLVSCELGSPSEPEPEAELVPVAVSAAGSADRFDVLSAGDTLLTAWVPKWPGGHRAAVSITYDAPWGRHPGHRLATDAVLSRGLRMDLEVVTANYLDRVGQALVATYRNDLIPAGIHFFGHGHTHALHDTMDYEGAYASFHTCFELMRLWGLEPWAYAYPGSSALRPSTQLANRDAGFVAARGQAFAPAEYYIVPDEVREPVNWQYLPSVVMGNASYTYIDTHDKLAPILDTALARSAWVILMYHAIGIPEGWSYYPIADFLLDLNQIADLDLWSANLDDACQYVRERDTFRLGVEGAVLQADGWTRLDLTFSDGLDNALYDEPLTVELRVFPRFGYRQARLEGDADGRLEFDLAAGPPRVDVRPDERTHALFLR